MDLDAHLRALEEQLLSTVTRRDPAAVSALLNEDFVEFGSSGRVWGRESIIAELAAAPAGRFKVADFATRELAEGVALVTYLLLSEQPGAGLRSSLRSSVWMRGPGGWRMLFHQGTPIPASIY